MGWALKMLAWQLASAAQRGITQPSELSWPEDPGRAMACEALTMFADGGLHRTEKGWQRHGASWHRCREKHIHPCSRAHALS